MSIIHGNPKGHQPARREPGGDGACASEQRYRTLFQSIQEGFVLKEAVRDAAGAIVDFRFLETNPAFTTQTGLDGVVGRTMREVLPELEPCWFEAYARVIESGEPIRFKDRAGPLGRWLEVFASRVGDGDQVAVLVSDITAHKQVERTLRESEARYRALADLSPDAILVNLDGRFVYANAAAARFLHAPDASHLIGLSPFDVIPSEHHDLVRRRVQTVLRDGAAVPLVGYRWKRLDGMLADAEVAAGPTTWDGKAAVQVVVRDVSERVCAERALLASEHRYAALIDALPVGVYLTDAEGRVTHCNAAAANLAARVPEYGVDRWCVSWKLYRPDGTPLQHEHCPMAIALRTGSAIQGEEVLVERPDGTRRSVVAYPKVLRDAGGRIVGGLNVLVDITARRQAEQALRNSEERLQLAMKAGAIGAWDLDIVTGTANISDSYRELFGIQPGASFTYDSWLAAVHPEDRERCEAYGKAFFESPQATAWELEFRVVTPHLGTRWHRAIGQVQRSAEGRPMRFVGVSVDMTARVQAEIALRESEARLRATFEQAAVGVAHVALDGTWLRVNPKLCETVGYAPEELLRLTFKEITHPDDLEADLAQARLLREGEIPMYAMEKRYIRKDGTPVWVNLTGALVRDHAGAASHFIAVVEDISSRKQAQEELRAAKKRAEEAQAAAEAANAAKDHFLAVLSHELRTPLAPVLMTASALEGDRSVPEWLREDMGLIRRSVDLEVRLIDDLLDLNRISRGKLELRRQKVDAHDKIISVVEICRFDSAEKGLFVETDLGAVRHVVNADSGRLQQVFWNLLKNSIKFTPRGGHIAVRSSNPEPGILRVEVADTGIGIAPDVLPHLFSAFEQGGRQVTRQFGGMGLGLAISKALVEMHGGRIAVRSDGPGKGAVLTLELPVFGSEPQRAAPGEEARDHHKPPALKLLLVEDHAATAQVVSRMLEKSGHEVTTANSVREAMRLAESGVFDILISDLGLPDGSGLDVIAALRARHPGLKAIAMSGFGMEQDLSRSRAAGFAEHLTKPVDFKTLEAALARLAQTP